MSTFRWALETSKRFEGLVLFTQCQLFLSYFTLWLTATDAYAECSELAAQFVTSGSFLFVRWITLHSRVSYSTTLRCLSLSLVFVCYRVTLLHRSPNEYEVSRRLASVEAGQNRARHEAPWMSQHLSYLASALTNLPSSFVPAVQCSDDQGWNSSIVSNVLAT